MVSRRSHWALSQTEQADFGDAVAGVMPSISPEVARQISNAAPWIRLVTVGGSIVATRVQADVEMNARIAAGLPANPGAGQTVNQGQAPTPPPAPPRPRHLHAVDGHPDVVAPVPGGTVDAPMPSGPKPPGPGEIEIAGLTSPR